MTVLRKISCFLTSLLLCVTATSLHAQTLPEGYELHPLGGGLQNIAFVTHAVGDDVYFGGEFSTAYAAMNGSTPVTAVAGTANIARWDGVQWHALGKGTDGDVRAITSAADGTIYVGGNFQHVFQSDGTKLKVNYIARFKDGQWSALDGGFFYENFVLSLQVVENAVGHDLYVGGVLSQARIDGEGVGTVNHVAQWDGTGWQLIGQGLSGSGVTSIIYSPLRNGLYIGGIFSKSIAQSDQGEVILNRLAFWSFDDSRWHVVSGEAVGEQSNLLESADGRFLYVAASSGIHQFNVETGEKLQLTSENTRSINWLPGQQRLIALHSDGVNLWEISQNPAVSLKIVNTSGGYSSVNKVTIVANGVYVGARNSSNNVNAFFIGINDIDGDEIANDYDNCPLHANNEQLDTDLDSAGDICDICPADALDNCLENPNGDFDGDGVNNGSDAFPEDSSEWADTDGDTIGDNKDNCRVVANSNQTDLDQDGVGDACDADIDGDSVPNDHDAFPVDDSKWRDGDVAERLGDAAKQHFGQVIVNLGDINNDYADDYAIGTPNFKASIQVNGKTKLLNKAGKVEVISGKTGDELLSLTGSAAKALLGSAIVAADVDRDDLIDIAIGSPGANKNSGEVVICLALVNGGFNCTDTITPDASFKGSLLGASLAVAEIENSTQLFVGAPKAKNAEKKTVGAVVRFENNAFSTPETRYGNAVNGEFASALMWLPQNKLLAIGAPKANKTGEVALWDVLNDAFEAPLTGIAAKEGFGRKLAVGSLADGVEHLAVAAPLAANGTLKQAGRVDVFDLASSNQTLKSFVGTSKGEQLGGSLAIDDKFNLFAGSPNYTVAKTASSKAIKKAGKVSRFILAANDAQAKIAGTEINQQFGFSLAAIELTGDFKLDLLVGSMGANDPANKKLKAVGKLELINANDWQ